MGGQTPAPQFFYNGSRYMWVRIVRGRKAGRLIAVADKEAVAGIKSGKYVRAVRHEHAVRDQRETARV